MSKFLQAHMSVIAAYYVWMAARALAWIALVSLLIHLATRNRRVVKAYWGAHLAALALGLAADAVLWQVISGTSGSIYFREAIFVAPIFIFTVISLWIGSWEKTVRLSDVFMTLLPLALFAGLVIKGWQDKEFSDVLGLWFVSAGSGGVDLVAIYGPGWAARRRTAVRLAGYVLMALFVYSVLPWTE